MNQKRERRKFDAALKIEMVRRMQERAAPGGPVAVIATDWPVRPAQRRQLRRELDVVRQERDFLKRAAAYFAKESR